MFPQQNFICNCSLPHTCYMPYLSRFFPKGYFTPMSCQAFPNTLSQCCSDVFVCETLLQIEIFREIPLQLLNWQYRQGAGGRKVQVLFCVQVNKIMLQIHCNFNPAIKRHRLTCVNLQAPRFFCIGTGVSLLSRERFLYV